MNAIWLRVPRTAPLALVATLLGALAAPALGLNFSGNPADRLAGQPIDSYAYGGMRPYSVCYRNGRLLAHPDPTAGHRNHIHLGVNWSGARMRSSFWRSGLR